MFPVAYRRPLDLRCDRAEDVAVGDPSEFLKWYLAPQGRVVSGHISALEHAAELAKERGAIKAQ